MGLLVGLITLSLLSGFISLWIADLSTQRRVRGAVELRLLMWLLGGWCIGYALILAVENEALMMALHRIKLGIICWVGLAWLVLVLRLTDNTQVLSRRWLITLTLPVMLMCTLALVNPPGWFYAPKIVESPLGFLTVIETHQTLYPLFTFVTLGYAIAGFVLFTRWAWQGRRAGRRISPFTWAFLVTFVVMVFIAPFTNRVYLDITPIVTSVISYAIGIGLLQLRVFDLLPVAYDKVIANMPDGLLIVDGNGRIRTMNTAMERLTGDDAKALEGELLVDAFPTLPPNLQDETEIYWHDRHIKLNRTPITDYQTEIHGYLLVFHDITQRKRAEDDLKWSLHQLDILRQISDEIAETLSVDDVLLISLDAALRLSGGDEGYIALFNDQRKLIASKIVGAVKFDFNEPDVYHAIKTRQAALITNTPIKRLLLPLTGRESVIGLLNLQTPKATQFTEETLSFMQILSDRIAVAMENARLYHQAQDQIEELQRLYQQVSHLEGIKTDMIRIAAHDLRNPLAVLMGYVSMMQLDQELLPEEYPDYIEQMLSAVRRSTVMINDILSLERIERMAQEQTAEPFDLVPQVREAVREFSWLSQEKKQTLSFDASIKNAVIHGDALQIYEAMINLISNAVKYTPEGGQINVRLAPVSGYQVILTVQDNGYGIPEDQQDDLFLAYARVKTEETGKIEGTGLGLNIVKNIIERHGGNLFFDSIYGEGSTFGFTLPLYKEPTEKAKKTLQDSKTLAK